MGDQIKVSDRVCRSYTALKTGGEKAFERAFDAGNPVSSFIDGNGLGQAFGNMVGTGHQSPMQKLVGEVIDDNPNLRTAQTADKSVADSSPRLDLPPTALTKNAPWRNGPDYGPNATQRFEAKDRIRVRESAVTQTIMGICTAPKPF